MFAVHKPQIKGAVWLPLSFPLLGVAEPREWKRDQHLHSGGPAQSCLSNITAVFPHYGIADCCADLATFVLYGKVEYGSKVCSALRFCRRTAALLLVRFARKEKT